MAVGVLLAGKRHGFWTLSYRTGEPRALGLYRLGSESGQWFYWYKNGCIAAHGYYAQGVERGLWSYYYEDGTLRARGTYTEDGERDGRWLYRNPEGRLECSEDWRGGRLVRRLLLMTPIGGAHQMGVDRGFR